jgi:hypothetical protein
MTKVSQHERYLYLMRKHNTTPSEVDAEIKRMFSNYEAFNNFLKPQQV